MIVLARIYKNYSRLLLVALVFLSLDASAFTIIQIFQDIDDIDISPGASPSTLITDVNTIDTSVKSVNNGLNNRVNKVLNKPSTVNAKALSNTFEQTPTGVAAGDPVNGVGIWASYGYSDFENNLSSTQFDGRTHNALLGIDFMPSSNTVVGIAFGLENTETDTDFNSGNQRTNGFTIAPYAGVSINEHVSADVSFGYTKLDNEQNSLVAITGLGTIPSESDFDSQRWFANANLNGYYSLNNWILTGQFGLLWAKNKQEQYQDFLTGAGPRNVLGRDTKLKQFYIATEAAYPINQFEPYARLSYVRDFSRTRLDLDPTLEQVSDDKDEFLVGGGVRVFSDQGVSGNFEYNKRLGRDDFEEDIVSFFLRMDL